VKTGPEDEINLIQQKDRHGTRLLSPQTNKTIQYCAMKGTRATILLDHRPFSYNHLINTAVHGIYDLWNLLPNEAAKAVSAFRFPAFLKAHCRENILCAYHPPGACL
jgi:hypothetical protein